MHRYLKQIVWIAGVTLASSSFSGAKAQTIRHDTGQDVAPVFEGWEHNPDGSYNFVFGYLNRNYEEQLDIPIGPENSFDSGLQDRGQPTHFYTRRQRFIFRVQVPKDWDRMKRLVWTVVSRGKTNQAKGWLEPEWELNPGVISENNGGGTLEAENKPPTIKGPSTESVTVDTPLSMSVTASDDGLPKPKPRRTPPPDTAAAATAAAAAAAAANPDTPVRLSEGMRVKWLHYRGPGKVTFDPDSSKPEYTPSASYTTSAKFSAPGLYVVRALVNDGQLETVHEITVTVR